MSVSVALGDGYYSAGYQADAIVSDHVMNHGYVVCVSTGGNANLGTAWADEPWDEVLFAHSLPLGEKTTNSNVVAMLDGLLVHLQKNGGGCTVYVLGTVDDDPKHMKEVLQSLRDKFVRPAEAEEEGTFVPMGFWHMGTDGSSYRKRKIFADPWEGIKRNYPGSAAKDLDALISLTTIDTSGGKLVLLYGPPGTGKTSYLRSLAWEWRDWARVDCVLDPEVFLNSPGYMFSVMQEEEGVFGDSTAGDDKKWRILLLEDAGELIKAGAKGQAISRLLNMADGIVGQGQKLMFLVTTNEPIEKLAEAVVRPGRCLSRIDVRGFNQAEASEWLGEPAPGAMTLADLYQEKRGDSILTVQEEEQAAGLYM